MSSSNDRFYQLELRDRPAFWGDIGSLIRIDGIVIGGSGADQVILFLPSAPHETSVRDFHQLSAEEWSDFLQRSDVPEVLVGGLEKAFHRKVRYEISGHVQQKVWVADGYKCMYCGQPMGKVQLSIDHFIPLELGGVNNTTNYLSACRRCNKDKGNEDPKKFCERRALNYDRLVVYLKERKV